jgi:hypothetical protein
VRFFIPGANGGVVRAIRDQTKAQQACEWWQLSHRAQVLVGVVDSTKCAGLEVIPVCANYVTIPGITNGSDPHMHITSYGPFAAGSLPLTNRRRSALTILGKTAWADVRSGPQHVEEIIGVNP